MLLAHMVLTMGAWDVQVSVGSPEHQVLPACLASRYTTIPEHFLYALLCLTLY